MSAIVKFKRDKGEGLLLLIPNSQVLGFLTVAQPAFCTLLL